MTDKMTNRLALQLSGTLEDNRDVRIAAFVKKVEAIRDALKATDQVMSDGESLFDYRIVNLSHSSPATVELEAIPLEDELVVGAAELIDTFYDVLNGIQQGKGVPEGFGYTTLQKFKRLEPKKSETPEVVISRNGDALKLTKDWVQHIEDILGPDQFEDGSVTGMLEQINVHGNNRIFTIYPTFGEPELRCRFDKDMREKVVRAVDNYVEVSGRLRYKADSLYPHFIEAHEIKVYPPEHQLPTLDDLFGAAPNITRGKSIEDFVEGVRNGLNGW